MMMTSAFTEIAPLSQRAIVTAEEMAAIESRIFEAGMPVAALMEKVASRIATRLQDCLPQTQPHPHVGVLAGPGHNGGDALVVARELWFKGYPVSIYRPIEKAKPLTQQHLDYARSLGIPCVNRIQDLATCNAILDGLFGFGQTRPLEGQLAEDIQWANQQSQCRLSIDLPSGIHTDTGAVLGTAFRADYTFCLGLWKRGFFQDAALDILGTVERLDFDIPEADIAAVLGEKPRWQRITADMVGGALPLPRPRYTHKYKQGHLLLVCGSTQYAGAAVLAGLGARGSGVGMLTLAVPASVKPLINAQLPEALVFGCPETADGAIAQLPDNCDLSRYDAIACGPGLSEDTDAALQASLSATCPLVLDASGLNLLAARSDWNGGHPQNSWSPNSTLVLTPHPGEFRRLFPEVEVTHPGTAAETAARQSQAIVVMKGARVAVGTPDGSVRFNPESTPALARGGSGDVLTGLMGGLVATASAQKRAIAPMVSAAVWWHARAALLAERERSSLGVDAWTLTQYLAQAIAV